MKRTGIKKLFHWGISKWIVLIAGLLIGLFIFSSCDSDYDIPVLRPTKAPRFFDGAGPGSGGPIAVDNAAGEGGLVDIGADGTGSISSAQLQSNLTVKTVVLGGDTLVPNLKAQWWAFNGRLELLVYDLSGKWAPAFYQGDPTHNTPGSVRIRSLSAGGSGIQPQVIISGAVLIIGMQSLDDTALDYPFLASHMSDSSSHNLVDNAKGYGVFRCTVGELAQYLNGSYKNKLITLSVAKEYLNAEEELQDQAWNIYALKVPSGASDLTTFLVDQLNVVENKDLYDTATAQTVIMVLIKNWNAVNNAPDYEADVAIMPDNWDDGYENNDTLTEARTLETVNANGLMVYPDDPDCFKIYLNPNDSWQGAITYMGDKGKLTFNLYDPNSNLVDSSAVDGNTQDVSVTNVSLPGWYYLEILMGSTAASSSDVSDIWSGNMYNLWVSTVGGQVTPGEGVLRFVLTWGDQPYDLDSHLWTPSIDGTVYHVYYANRMDPNVFPFVGLDVDDTSSYGPETVTINQLYPGTYHYSIYNFSGSPDITTSAALITVFGKFGLITEQPIPTTGSGVWWHVFDIDGTSGNLTLINQVNNTSY